MAIYTPNPNPILYDCSACWTTFDTNWTPRHFVADRPVCQECVSSCEVCGEYLSDAITDRGPHITYRDLAYDGDRRDAHAECAAVYLADLFALAEAT